MAGQVARHKRAALACLLAGLAAALPARADLPAPVESLLHACLAEGLTPTARVAAAQAAGWGDLPETARPSAAQALAPWQILRRFGLDAYDALSPADLAEYLAIAADDIARVIAAGISSDHWFTLPDGAGYARIVDFLGDGAGVECLLSAAIDADDVAASLGLPIRRLDRDSMTLSLFDLPAGPADRGAIVSHFRLAEGGEARPPILMTPRMPRPAPPPGTTTP